MGNGLQTNRQTDRQTNRHVNSMTDPARGPSQWKSIMVLFVYSPTFAVPVRAELLILQFDCWLINSDELPPGATSHCILGGSLLTMWRPLVKFIVVAETQLCSYVSFWWLWGIFFFYKFQLDFCLFYPFTYFRICVQIQFSQPTPELGPLQAEFWT